MRVDSEVMVVGRDLDLAGLQLLHRMISAVMTEFQLKSLSAQGNACELMPQADSENRLPSHEPADGIYCVCAWLRVARAVREEDAVRLQGEHVLRLSLGRNYRHATAFAAQLAQNVLLDAEIVGHYVEAWRL